MSRQWCDQNDPSPAAIAAKDDTFVPNGQTGLAGNELGTYTGSPWWRGCMEALGFGTTIS